MTKIHYVLRQKAINRLPCPGSMVQGFVCRAEIQEDTPSGRLKNRRGACGILSVFFVQSRLTDNYSGISFHNIADSGGLGNTCSMQIMQETLRLIRGQGEQQTA